MDGVTVSALGAIIALVVSIVLIFMKVPPIYSLMLGALLGGVLGGISLTETISLMIVGTQGMMTTVLRILAAGVLAGVLIQSGAADSISQAIINWVGEKRALFALALATLILTSVGVFIDIAVITVGPIALATAKKTGISRTAILVAMIGGGKAGNMMSPNPNTIAVSDAFNQPLTSIMLAGVIPAIVAVIFTYFLSSMLINKGTHIKGNEVLAFDDVSELPSFGTAILGPLVAILLLASRPLFGIVIDPMLALPIGGIVGAIAMNETKNLMSHMEYGLSKMTGVVIILIGTGVLAGIIQNSTIGDLMISTIQSLGLPIYLLAPISGILMSGATASTTSGSTVASQVFSSTLLNAGVNGVAGGSMIHTGATVLDHLPHGSFFHATAGSVNMYFKERLQIIVYESLIGLVLTATSVILYGILGLAG